MAVHKLIIDNVFETLNCTLIAIHCTIEDYRIAYLLNKQLGINLARKKTDLDYRLKNATYPIFEWNDDKNLTIWSLVANSCKNEIIKHDKFKSLFNSEEKKIQTTYLVPEYKAVNYFLKVENQFNLTKEKFILKNILEIQQIATAFCIDINQLKSKDNLIFN